MPNDIESASPASRPVIEHLVPRVAVLREIHRLLTDDGQLLVSGPNSQSRWRHTLRRAGLFAYSDPDHKIEYTDAQFRAKLAAAGFEILEAKGLNYLGMPAVGGTFDVTTVAGNRGIYAQAEDCYLLAYTARRPA